MTISNQLREQIDACRSGSGDLALPELAQLAQAVERDPVAASELARAQQFDRNITVALHDLPVPAGLAHRLIAATHAAAATADANLPLAVVTNAHNHSLRRNPVSRRRMLVVGGSLALAALVAVSSISYWLRPRSPVTQEQLAADVEAWLGLLEKKPWTPAAALPKNISIDPAVAATPLQWQQLTAANSAGWSADVTVINLAPTNRPGAVLFVVKSSAKFTVPYRPLVSRLSLSRGFAATAWQRQGSNLLYILVVKESGGLRLDDYLRTRSAA